MSAGWLAGLDVTIKVTNAEDAGSVELSQIEPREGRAVTAKLSGSGRQRQHQQVAVAVRGSQRNRGVQPRH